MLLIYMTQNQPIAHIQNQPIAYTQNQPAIQWVDFVYVLLVGISRCYYRNNEEEKRSEWCPKEILHGLEKENNLW